MEEYQKIERSLITTYRKTIWNRFTRSLSDYDLIQSGDKIAVCISGGKDSFLLAKCMQEIQRHGKVPFELKFLTMDPGYRPENRARIEENARRLNLDLHIFETDIFDVVADIHDSPCYLCARMRRGHLYKNAQSLGCNKIALGHHFDDVIETILMSMLYGSEMKTMMPKLHSTNYPGMQLIRPLYQVKEADIVRWAKGNGLEFIQCACRFTERHEVNANGAGGKRAEMKRLIAQFRNLSPNIEMSIFRSCHNVNLNTVIGYTLNGVQHDFVREYAQSENGFAGE